MPIFTTMLTKYYYSFVDRDMYMRYAGGGVGHYKINVNDPHTVTQDPGDADDGSDEEVEEENEEGEEDEDEDGSQR